ncbi:C-3 sterol dehydrogenase/C-4 decarboxylase [Massariosphaeria phaeospora]|uniref:C-3 sterol dehydrogenase/C-4 decarboxylase n=1 Tax=Massariosphaeria phaeospora TaxID=100035 RepID=A0A7C8IKE6_9PLEO|nr:C-3 sterol dehydrogenase/C-4 decarboxylase [Massariosphaeria phaeospora]
MENIKFDTVLVVGGFGFLGSHIVQRLLSGNHATKIVITSRNAQETDPRAQFYACDITSRDAVSALFEDLKPQVVIHTVSPPPRSKASGLRRVNVDGTNNLLYAAKSCPATRAFIYTSSDSAMHPAPFKAITEAEAILYTRAHSPNAYSLTKALADAAVLAANAADLRTATLRVPMIYGERDTGYLPQVVASIRAGQHMQQAGPNEKVFSVLYAESAAHAHILAAHALVTGSAGADGQAFFITDGEPMPFFDFYRKCCAAAGHAVRKEDVKVNPFWMVKAIASAGEWLYWVATLGTKTPKLRRDDIEVLDRGCWWNDEKARRVLGFENVLGMDEAVKRTMEWGMKEY